MANENPKELIPLSIPCLGGNEWKYIKDCLDSNVVAAAGPYIQRFEQAVASFVGAPHAVATSSGTSAIHVALRSLDVGPGDAVIVPDFTFVAPANAVKYCGALPIFVDVERRTGTLNPARVEDFLRKDCDRLPDAVRHRATGRRVRVILPVHIYGHPVDLDAIDALAKEFDLTVVEDAAECLGARYKASRIGERGDLICFSFNGNKVITAGAGGMIVGSKEPWLRRSRHLATQARAHPTEYIHDEVGFNYRMPSLNAALGLAQMELLDAYLLRKREISAHYAGVLKGVPGISLITEEPWAWSSYWLNTILIDPQVASVSKVVKALHDERIEARRVWPPMKSQLPYRDCPSSGGSDSEWLYERGINLPSSVGITSEQIERVARTVVHALNA